MLVGNWIKYIFSDFMKKDKSNIPFGNYCKGENNLAGNPCVYLIKLNKRKMGCLYYGNSSFLLCFGIKSCFENMPKSKLFNGTNNEWDKFKHETLCKKEK